MEPNQTQDSKTSQAAASLSFATHLQGQLMAHQSPPVVPQEATQRAQNAPGQEMEPKDEETDMTKEFSSFKEEIQGMIKSEIGDLKREIEMALAEDNPNSDEKKTNPQQTA